MMIGISSAKLDQMHLSELARSTIRPRAADLDRPKPAIGGR